MLVIHENRGLTDHIRNVAGRFAASGWSALALDLLSEEGGTGAFPGEAEVAAALSAIAGTTPERFDADMKAALTELGEAGRAQAARGDRLLLRRRHDLAPAGHPRAATVGGRAVLRTVPDRREPERQQGRGARRLRRARLARQRDPPAAVAALEAARLEHEILTFSEADHAFFNDTGARFNPMAAEEAWRRVVGWFDDTDDNRGHHD